MSIDTEGVLREKLYADKTCSVLYSCQSQNYISSLTQLMHQYTRYVNEKC